MPNSSGSGPASADYDKFDQLAEEFAERHRRGEHPSLQEYIDRHPELADAIRDLFPALIEVERAEGDHREVAESAPPAPTMGQVGDYRILREIGRGGMGVVYEAEQISLGRRVALKMLPRQVAQDRKTLARFRREARSAAGLHHTNIVPVYEVGKDGEISFYAMQFIQGQALDSVIHELRKIKDHARSIGAGSTKRNALGGSVPDRELNRMAQSILTGRFAAEGAEGSATESHVGSRTGLVDGSTERVPRSGEFVAPEPLSASSSAVLPGGSQISTIESGRRPFFRSVAQIGRQAAAGLAYAHARGIVHRDIKPSNLMLDTEGVVWITDFGLAKAADDGLTQTGDIVGTLRYMAPERFRGEGDGRADVYALGLTLYELLTLRPAFDSPDRLKLIEQIKSAEPPRPRSLDPRIPRDLETIILKAIDKEPKSRYATADAMAEDLRRFVDDEPILARRDSLAEKVARAARRNPAIATLGVVLVGTLVMATLGSLLAANRMRGLVIDQKEATRTAQAERMAAEASRKNESSERIRAVRALDLAEANFAKARAAVDDYLTKVTDSPAMKGAGTHGLRRDLLSSAMTFYARFLEDRRDDPSLRGDLATVHLRVAKIHNEMGEMAAKVKSGREAQKLYEALAKSNPGDPAIQAGLVEASFLADDLKQAVELGERLVASRPDDLTAKSLLAEAYNGLYKIRSAESDQINALRAQERSLALREELFRRQPENAEYEYALGASLNNLGAGLQSINRRAEALDLYRRAAFHDQNVFAKQPWNYAFARGMLIGTNNVSTVEAEEGLRLQAIETNRKGIEIARKLTATYPEVPEFVLRYHQLAQNRMLWIDLKANRQEGLAAYREFIEVSKNPKLLQGLNFQANIGNFRGLLAQSETRYADLIRDDREDLTAAEKAEIERLQSDAVENLNQAIDRSLPNPNFFRRNNAFASLQKRPDFQAMLVRLDRKLQESKQPKVDVDAPKVAAAKPSDLSTAKSTAVKPPSSAESRASEASRKASAIQLRGDLAASRLASGQFLTELREWDEAKQALAEAVAARNALAMESPEDPQLQLDLAKAYFALGNFYRNRKEFPRALVEWTKGSDLLIGLVTQAADDDALITEAVSMLSFHCDTLKELALFTDYLKVAAPLQVVHPVRNARYIEHKLNETPYGLVCLANGDLEGYRRGCKRAVELFSELRSDWTGHRMSAARVSVMSPDSGIDPMFCLGLMEKSLHDTEHWRILFLALANYRVNRFEECLKQLDRFRKAVNNVPLDQDVGLITAELIRAMALHRLDRDEEARASLKVAHGWEEEFGRRFINRTAAEPAPINFYTWLDNRILIVEAESLIEKRPPRRNPWNELVTAWADAQFGRPDAARASLLKITSDWDQDAEILGARAHLYRMLGDKEKAESLSEAALKINAAQPLARQTRGLEFLGKGRPKEGAADLVKVLEKLPDGRELNAERAPIDIMLAANDEAFQQAVRLRPNDPQLWVARGRHLAWKHRWKDAAEAYAKGIGSREVFFDWIEYGAVLVLAEDFEGYRRFCAEVAERMKTPAGRKGPRGEFSNRTNASRIGRLSPNSGITPQQLRAWAVESIQQQPNAVDYLFAGAAASYRADQLAAARLLAERTISVAPEWPAHDLNWYVLAMVHHRLGRVDDARRWFDQAERAVKRHEAEMDREPTPPAGVYLCDYLEALVLQREAKAVLATKPGDAKPKGPPGAGD